jgi:hypothetical protein
MSKDTINIDGLEFGVIDFGAQEEGTKKYRVKYDDKNHGLVVELWSENNNKWFVARGYCSLTSVMEYLSYVAYVNKCKLDVEFSFAAVTYTGASLEEEDISLADREDSFSVEPDDLGVIL